MQNLDDTTQAVKSIQFNFIVPNQNINYLKALYIESEDLQNYRGNPTVPTMSSTLASVGRKKSLINWKKPLSEPDSMRAAICLNRLGWAEKIGRRGEMGGGEERGRERRERPGTHVHHQVSALTSYNENNKNVKMLLMIATTIYIIIIIRIRIRIRIRMTSRLSIDRWGSSTWPVMPG